MSLNKITRFGGKVAISLKAKSPAILMGIGIAGFVGTAVLASKATLHVGDILDEGKENEDKIKGVHEGKLKTKPGTVYTEEDYKRDLIVNRVQTAIKIAKLYAPTVLVGIGATACVLGAHHILSKRNTALIATVAGLTESLNEYRNRVANEFGQDVEDAIYHGKDIPGKKKKAKKDSESTDIEAVDDKTYNMPSMYARIFDETNMNWSKSPEENKFFLQQAQNMFNDRLHAVGYVFLNEIYDVLGFSATPAGQIVGWVDNSAQDNFIDFGIFDTAACPERSTFINSDNPSILLDFNVDGVIYDLI